MKNFGKNTIVFFLFSVLMGGCFNANLNPKNSRIFVVEERKLSGEFTFFWFRDAGQITHTGIDYFQISIDKCNLSIKNANAYCNEAIQVLQIKGDSIYVLTLSEIKQIKSANHFEILSIPYSIELYDVTKKPIKENQYFLDSLCK